MYTHYYNYINEIVQLPSLPDFKSNQHYCGILEHMSHSQGLEYLHLIKTTTNLSEESIIEYCKENDRIGGGVKYDFGFVHTSPSNFRYIFHCHLILKHICNLNINDIDIVELGGGYGGLCLAINIFSSYYGIKIKRYNLIDLPVISTLQKKYLDNHNLKYKVNSFSAFNYGIEINEKNLFVISNYCFSEIANEYQQNYIKFLFPKVEHGFMVWNHIPLYNFVFNYKEETEYPLTGHLNKYVYF